MDREYLCISIGEKTMKQPRTGSTAYLESKIQPMYQCFANQRINVIIEKERQSKIIMDLNFRFRQIKRSILHIIRTDLWWLLRNWEMQGSWRSF